MLDSFQSHSRDLLDALEGLKELSELREDGNIIKTVTELEEKLASNSFYLVVLGEFKRGKSTFINSLLGTKLLPTSVVPLTSIVTMLYYGDREKIEVIFLDDSIKEIKREELPDYVTEKGNPGNEKKVKRVEISYPSEYLKGGVHIIDTPGVGSIFEDNTKVTYDFLPKVDAALFLISADPPMSRAELDFLKDVAKYVHKIFFIQNKIDYIPDEDERYESMMFSKKVIEEALGEQVEIYPLSAKMALEGKLSKDETLIKGSYLPQLDDLLADFLTREKGKILLQSVYGNARKLLSDEEFAIQLELRAIATPLEDLEKKIKLFEEKIEEIQDEKKSNAYMFEVEIKRITDGLDRDLERLRKKVLPKLYDELSDIGKSHRNLDIKEYIKVIEDALRKGIVKTFDEWIMKEEERLNEDYSRISRQYSDRANRIIDILIKASAELFDIQLEHIKSEEEISADKRFYYLLGDPPRFFDLAGAIDFFSRTFLPKGLSQAKVLRDVMKKLPERIDANCGRVRADFMYRIRESFLKFRWDLNSKIDATTESIRQALNKAVDMKRTSAEEMGKRQAQLKEQQSRLDMLKARFQEIETSLASM